MNDRSDQNIIVVGASGNLGRPLINTLYTKNLNYISLSKSGKSNSIKFNVENEDISSIVKIKRGDVVIMLAAHSDQKWINENPQLSRKLNVEGTLRLIDQINKYMADLVFISSEAVFGFESNSIHGWNEKALTKPMSLYGKQKAEVENYITNIGNGCIIRTGWNVPQNSIDRCIVKTMHKELLQRNSCYADDAFLTLTNVEETANAIALCIEHKIKGILHVASKKVSRSKIADTIIKYSKYSKDMQYQKVKYIELKGQMNRANNAILDSRRTIEYLNLNISAPEDTIRKKVLILEDMLDKFKGN